MNFLRILLSKSENALKIMLGVWGNLEELFFAKERTLRKDDSFLKLTTQPPIIDLIFGTLLRTK